MNSQNPINCPKCGGEFLHHDSAVVCNRKEDSSVTEFISVSTDGQVDSYQGPSEDNSSQRRDSVEVRFWCEMCHHKPTLLVKQHKGQTFIELY